MSRFQGRRFTVKERRLTFGRQYRVFDAQGGLLAYVKQKMFKLKEDIVFFADESKQQEVLRLQATKILDFSANLQVTDPQDGPLGFVRHKGWRSLFRDKWHATDLQGNVLAELSEDSWLGALFRRFGPFGFFWLHRYELRRLEDHGQSIATIKERFQIFGDTYDVTIHGEVDPRMVIALAVCVDAFESE